MRPLRLAAFATVALAASLLLARVHPFGDAGLLSGPRDNAALLAHASVPPQVRDLLANKCADCHSAVTRTPFYGHFAPISWLLERDILEGRRHMNLSAWDTYTADQQDTLKAKIVQETKSRKMPLPQYQMIHWNSRITSADVASLTHWVHGDDTPGSGAVVTLPGDPTRGQAVFEKRCTGCHSLTNNREGPRLQSVYGRATGTVPNFPYSAALLNAHLTWNDATLEQWLTDPDAFLPGNNMDFLVAKPQERRDLIAWFKQSAGK